MILPGFGPGHGSVAGHTPSLGVYNGLVYLRTLATVFNGWPAPFALAPILLGFFAWIGGRRTKDEGRTTDDGEPKRSETTTEDGDNPQSDESSAIGHPGLGRAVVAAAGRADRGLFLLVVEHHYLWASLLVRGDALYPIDSRARAGSVGKGGGASVDRGLGGVVAMVGAGRIVCSVHSICVDANAACPGAFLHRLQRHKRGSPSSRSRTLI